MQNFHPGTLLQWMPIMPLDLKLPIFRHGNSLLWSKTWTKVTQIVNEISIFNLSAQEGQRHPLSQFQMHVVHQKCWVPAVYPNQ